jgi:hypothetical protein
MGAGGSSYKTRSISPQHFFSSNKSGNILNSALGPSGAAVLGGPSIMGTNNAHTANNQSMMNLSIMNSSF